MKTKLKEYSKRVIALMILLWFIGAFFGGLMVWKTSSDLSSLLEYISAPMTVGILGYLLKAAFENREKIKKNQEGNENELDHR